jgi:hypothetical protein
MVATLPMTTEPICIVTGGAACLTRGVYPIQPRFEPNIDEIQAKTCVVILLSILPQSSGSNKASNATMGCVTAARLA